MTPGEGTITSPDDTPPGAGESGCRGLRSDIRCHDEKCARIPYSLQLSSFGGGTCVVYRYGIAGVTTDYGSCTVKPHLQLTPARASPSVVRYLDWAWMVVVAPGMWTQARQAGA
jgi:hypothetical protein